MNYIILVLKASVGVLDDTRIRMGRLRLKVEKDWVLDPAFGGSKEAAKKYVDNVLSKENSYERKYVSIDGVKNSGRANGKEYYTSWFTEEGYSPNHAQVATYKLKKMPK